MGGLAFQRTNIPGCYVIDLQYSEDVRGDFLKLYHEALFRKAGVEFTPREIYISQSHKGVIRGMHFQTPPNDHGKLVTCLSGSVLDVVVDLRKGSPSYQHAFHIELSEVNKKALFVPSGLAHGFCATSEQSAMAYFVSSVHAPENDQGILWSSIKAPWPVKTPIISIRDEGFPELKTYQSPFVYQEGAR